MILFKRNEAIGIMIVTATEKAVLPDTVFNILFTHELTKKTVLVNDAQDISATTSRYNQFEIDTSLFDELDNGFYTYEITDQANNLLEVGKMKLVGDKVIPVQYQDTPTEYTTYGR
jgi:hypothetical protein